MLNFDLILVPCGVIDKLTKAIFCRGRPVIAKAHYSTTNTTSYSRQGIRIMLHIRLK